MCARWERAVPGKKERRGNRSSPDRNRTCDAASVGGLVGPLPLPGQTGAAGGGGPTWPLPALAPMRYATLPARFVFKGVMGRGPARNDGQSPLRAALSLFSRPAPRTPMPGMSAHPGFSGPALPGAGGAGEQKEDAAGERREVLGTAGLAGPEEQGAGPGEAAGEACTPAEEAAAEGCAPTEEVGAEVSAQPEATAAEGGARQTADADGGPARADEVVAVEPGGTEESAGPAAGADGSEGRGVEGGLACDGGNGEALLAAGRDVPAGGLPGAGRARGLLGVDIGSHWLKIVQAEFSGGLLTIWRCGTWPVPAGTVAAGQIQDPDAVASLLREAKAAFRGRHCVGAVDGQKAILRQVQLPAMTRRELEAMLRLQGDQYLPLPWSEAEVDFTVLNRSGPQMRVLLVAAHAGAARALAYAVQTGGLIPTALETDSVALARALELVVAREQGSDPQGTLTIGVHLGAAGTLVFASRQGTPLLTRVLPLGGRHFTEALARELGIAEEPAEAYKQARGLEIPELRPLAERLASEVAKTVEYYLDQTERGLVPRVYLTGGGARLKGLCEVLASWVEQALVRWGRLPAGRWIGPARLPEGAVRWGCDRAGFGPEHFLALGLSMRGSKK